MSVENRFAHLTYDDFKKLATDPNLSCYEKIGFPDTYRAGKEKLIFEDILSKLPSLSRPNQTILDIGPGCSELPHFLIDWCAQQNHQLLLVDSAEMLQLLPDAPFIRKIEGFYPKDFEAFMPYLGQVNAILCYSVLHYIFEESNVYTFLDRSIQLLAHEGEMLIGDIPNLSKRKRFFSSPTGIRFHQAFMQTDTLPVVNHYQPEPHQIDDTVIIGLLLRAREAGCDSYWLPQNDTLPMANRREDILICKP